MNRLLTHSLIGVIAFAALFTAACNIPKDLSSKKTPHEKYKGKLEDAGLSETKLVTRWISAADKGLTHPLQVALPYRETSYFEMENPDASGYSFDAKRGEQVKIEINTSPVSGFQLFTELWQANGSQDPTLLGTADAVTHTLLYDVKSDGNFVLRIQPELLQNVGYTVTITKGPSLAFPINKSDKPRVSSFWGASRDNGARSHEGIDIVAKKFTPVVAVADGHILSVKNGGLGGKTISMRPRGKDYSVYYAHLEEQWVTPGQQVKQGDTLGLVGNTGNAEKTVPHLHFGIYAAGGAVDPLAFVNENNLKPKQVKADTSNLRGFARVKSSAAMYSKPGASDTKLTVTANRFIKLLAATDNYYRVRLPGGEEGFIPASAVSREPLRKQVIKKPVALLDKPSTDALTKTELTAGSTLTVWGIFDNYQWVQSGSRAGWIRI